MPQNRTYIRRVSFKTLVQITIKTYRNNASEAKDLSQKEGWIGHEDEEGALKEGVLSDVGELGQQGGDAAHETAHKETGTEYAKEVQDCLYGWELK